MNNESNLSQSLFNNPRYAEAIAATTQIAQEDYNLVEQELRPVEDTLRELERSLSSRLSHIKMASISQQAGKTQRDTSTYLADIYQRLTNEKATDIQQLRETLRAKKRTVGHFTLVIMGRTKAGKSTLFSTLLGHGYEGIGTGGQRTTRENKSYDLDNGIRLIDTPGIAAVGGEADEAEALRAVAEADLICYVMTDDSAQVAEFEFLGKLKQQTKPLVILLNVQYNLENKVLLKRFFKKADEMLTGEDISSHKERIFRYAREHYQNDSITVIPVMLFAAQLSRQKDDPELCQQLYNASRMQDFLNWISNAIENYGALLASQTLLGETGVSLTPKIATIQQEIKTCQESSKLLEKKQQELISKLKRVGKDGNKKLEVEIQEIFQDLSHEVPNFARNNWDKDTDTQKENWKKLRDDEVKLSGRIENFVDRLQADYIKRNQEILDEISKDFQFMALSKHQDFGFFGVDAGFDFQSIFSGLGSLLALVSFIPGVNFLVAGAGIFVSIISGFFETKEERKQKNCKKIEQTLKREIESQHKNYIKSITQVWEQACGDHENRIKQHFQDLEKELNDISNLLQKSTDSITKARDYLTGFFALRIFYWCQNQNEKMKINRSVLPKTIVRLTRNPGKYFSIYLKIRANPKIEDQKKCSQMLGEDIKFIMIN